MSEIVGSGSFKILPTTPPSPNNPSASNNFVFSPFYERSLLERNAPTLSFLAAIVQTFKMI